jgi:hypothetical protein
MLLLAKESGQIGTKVHHLKHTDRSRTSDEPSYKPSLCLATTVMQGAQSQHEQHIIS